MRVLSGDAARRMDAAVAAWLAAPDVTSQRKHVEFHRVVLGTFQDHLKKRLAADKAVTAFLALSDDERSRVTSRTIKHGVNRTEPFARQQGIDPHFFAKRLTAMTRSLAHKQTTASESEAGVATVEPAIAPTAERQAPTVIPVMVTEPSAMPSRDQAAFVLAFDYVKNVTRQTVKNEEIMQKMLTAFEKIQTTGFQYV